MRNVLRIIALSLIVVAVVACGKDEPWEYGDFRFDMVTFSGYDDGGHALFALLQRDDSRTDLRTTARCSLEAEPGQRMMLNYVPAGSSTGGFSDIAARGYTLAFTDSLRFTSRPDSIVMDSVRLRSVWRTGNYLNLTTELKYTEGKRRLAIVMDKDTWHSDTVHAYLSHDMLGEQAFFWRKCYISVYVGAVWKLQSCKVVRLHLNDVVYPSTRYYDFAK